MVRSNSIIVETRRHPAYASSDQSHDSFDPLPGPCIWRVASKVEFRFVASKLESRFFLDVFSDAD